MIGEEPPKALLNNVMLKIVAGRPEGGSLKKGEIAYNTTTLAPGQMQSQVIMSCLPNHLATVPFAGEVCSNERDAVNSAAAIALQNIMADPELKALHDRETPPRLAKLDEKCMNFLQGKCRLGAECRRSHEP